MWRPWQKQSLPRVRVDRTALLSALPALTTPAPLPPPYTAAAPRGATRLSVAHHGERSIELGLDEHGRWVWTRLITVRGDPTAAVVELQLATDPSPWWPVPLPLAPAVVMGWWLDYLPAVFLFVFVSLLLLAWSSPTRSTTPYLPRLQEALAAAGVSSERVGS